MTFLDYIDEIWLIAGCLALLAALACGIVFGIRRKTVLQATKFGLTVDKGVGVFNGDMGVITEINQYTETIEVEFDEARKVKYGYDTAEELELAYAITVHKSQGSEYPAVIIPLLQGPRLLYNRNLLYTAVTRAKKCLTIVGSDTVFQEMIQNKNEQERYTSLAERIREFRDRF